MVGNRVRRRRGRRLLFVVLLGAGVWYLRSRRSGRDDGLDALPAPHLASPPPPAAPRALLTPAATTVDPAVSPAPAEPAVSPAPAELAAPVPDDAGTPPAEVTAAGNGSGDEVAGSPAAGTPSQSDGSPPGPDYTIKGNAGSMLFHPPTSPYYKRTKAEVWFRTPEEARAAGFTEWTPRRRADR